MQFASSAEAFNFYKTTTPTLMESRSKAIQAEIAGNVNADLEGLTRELEGIREALKETRDQEQPKETRGSVVMTGGDAGQVWDTLSTPEYHDGFLKTLRKRDDFSKMETRADEFNMMSNSSAVIPTKTFDQVIAKAMDQGGVINLVRRMSVNSYVDVPVGVPIERANWHKEGEKVESEMVDTTFVRFDATEVMKTIAMSKAARIMSIDAFESYVTDQLASSVMNEVAYSLVWGTGEGEGQGIETIDWVEGTNQLTIAENKWINWRDLLEAIAMLHRGYSRRASWVCNNKTLYTGVYGICDDNNRPLYLEDAKDGGNGRLLGFPVVVDDFMPDNELIFGDWSYLALNMPQSIQLDRSDQAHFDQALIDYRAFAIADSRVILPEAFVRVVMGD